MFERGKHSRAATALQPRLSTPLPERPGPARDAFAIRMQTQGLVERPPGRALACPGWDSHDSRSFFSHPRPRIPEASVQAAAASWARTVWVVVRVIGAPSAVHRPDGATGLVFATGTRSPTFVDKWNRPAPGRHFSYEYYCPMHPSSAKTLPSCQACRLTLVARVQSDFARGVLQQVRL